MYYIFARVCKATDRVERFGAGALVDGANGQNQSSTTSANTVPVTNAVPHAPLFVRKPMSGWVMIPATRPCLGRSIRGHTHGIYVCRIRHAVNKMRF